MAFEVDDSDLQRKLGAFSRTLDRAMTNAVRDVQIRIANEAKTTTLFRDRTGALRQSIRPGTVTGSFGSGSLRATVIAGGGTVRYARFVHDGTKAHPIFPRRARALRIPTGAGFVFRASVPRHPGTRARPYMDRAADAVRPQIPTIVGAYVTRAVREAGLS